jgi:histidine ammonia-lyase
VSMAPAAGKRLWEMAENTRGVLAVEWLAAVQGLDLRNGLKTSPKLEKARAILRKEVPFYEKDRFFAPDINVATELLVSRCLTGLIAAALLPSL